MHFTQWTMRCSEPGRVALAMHIHTYGYIRAETCTHAQNSRDIRVNVSPCSAHSHFPRNTAHSKLEMACCTLQKNAWLRATRSIPRRTGMLSACVEYSSADRRLSLRSMSGSAARPWAISAGSRDSRWRWEPMSSERRM